LHNAVLKVEIYKTLVKNIQLMNRFSVMVTCAELSVRVLENCPNFSTKRR
jgi:hypothetical protein